MTYHYRIRAENAVSYSSWSNGVPASVHLAAPSGLVAAVPPAAPLRVALRWANRSFATGIDVQRATNPTFTSGPGTTADRRRRQPPGRHDRTGHHVLLPGTDHLSGRRLGLVDGRHGDHSTRAGHTERGERHRQRAGAGHRDGDPRLGGEHARRPGSPASSCSGAGPGIRPGGGHLHA